VLPSLKVPIAESCWLVVAAIVTFPGRIAIEAKSAALTLAEVAPLIEPEAAVIVTVPRFRAVSRPLTVIEATLVLDELQVALPVTSCVVPSENAPVAVNCCKVPSGNDAVTGVTAMEVKVAFVTVNTALEEILPEIAVMVEVPGAFAFASPGAPFTLIPATEVFAETHCTDLVRFCVLPFVKVPVAANCTVVPCAMEAV
jgi:hypothetical protein